MTDSELKSRLQDLLGPKGWLEESDQLEPYVTEWRGLWRGSCLGVAIPDSTEQVSAILKICSDTRTSVVPHGGNTGLVGGGVPNGGIVLSTKRLNRIRELDTANQTMTVDAGCILADIQDRATEAGLYFPLSLGAEGTCRIGGNLATNAGGVGVLRYGNARDLALGLEVVLPSGEIWDGLKALRKDNTGYDLKHLFIGSEGTLGVITGAVLKLYPYPQARQTVMAAVSSVEDLLAFYTRIRNRGGDNLTAFEIINAMAMELVSQNIPEVRNPFGKPYPYYALLDFTSSRAEDDLRAVLEPCLSEALEEGTIVDAVFAESTAQADDLWRLREAIPEAQVIEGASIKHDISVPVSRIPDFIQQAEAAVSGAMEGVRIVNFGHMGDGNLHFNLTLPKGSDGPAFLDKWDDFNRIIHDIAMSMGGSFSAEHGLGRLKRDELVKYGSPAAISLMRSIKQTLDPAGIMNPGKVIPEQTA